MAAIELGATVQLRENAGPFGHEERLGIIQHKYAGPGNVINYATTLFEGAITGRYQEAFDETVQNISTAVVEQVLADIGRPYQYALNIEGDRFRCDFGYLDEMIQRGIENESGQGYDFEIPRFRQNAVFLNKLINYKNAAIAGKAGESVAVEFSPAPEDTQEAAKRGYLHDTLSIFKFNPQTQLMEVRQLWFDCIRQEGGLQRYQELFKSLNAMDPNVRDSLDCMTNSGIYTAAQLAQIEQFVQANGGITNQAVDLALADSARKYQTDKIETAVIMDIISILGDTGIQEVIENDYKHPSPIKNYHTQYLLNEVANRIKVLQFGFRKYLSDEFNVSTLSAATKAQIKENMPKSASWQDISKFLDDIGFIARGCGFTIDDERPEVKNSMSVIDAGKNSTGVHMSEWEHLYCPHCHQYVKLIKNGDPTTYFQGSHHCGQLLSCN